MGPLVMVSEIRRHTNGHIFLLEAFAVFYSLTSASLRWEGASFLDDPWAIVRLTIPGMTALFVLLLRNSYVSAEGRPHYASTLDVTLAAAFVLLSQVILSRISPELVLPRWAPTNGAFVGWLFLAAVRALFPPQPENPHSLATGARPHVSFLEIQWRAEELERATRRLDLTVYLAAAVALAVFAVYFVLANTLRVRLGCGLLLAGTVYLVYWIRQRGVSTTMPTGSGVCRSSQLYVGELKRQHALFHRVWYWYFGFFVPGVVLLLVGSRLYGYFVMLYVFLFAELIYRSAKQIEREIEVVYKAATD